MRNSSQILTGDGLKVVKTEQDTPLPSTKACSKGLVRVKREKECKGFVACNNIPIKHTNFDPVRIFGPPLRDKRRFFKTQMLGAQAQNKKRILELQFYILQFLASTASLHPLGMKDAKQVYESSVFHSIFAVE